MCNVCIGNVMLFLADLSHRRRVCSGVVQETADQPSTVVDVSPAVASAQPRRRFPPPSRLLPGTVASQPSLLPRSTGVSGRWSGSNSCVIVLYFEAESGTADIEERLELSQVKVRGFEHPGGMLL
nr:uncharacterized protein LOC109193957 isoform X1 [Ipomoea batatas]